MKLLTTLDRMKIVKKTRLFDHCTVEQLLKIALIFREERYQKGQTVFCENDPGDSLFCIYKGKVLLTKQGDSKEIIIGESETFGILDILDNKSRLHTATANENCVLLTLKSEDFYDLLSNNIEIVRGVFAFLAAVLRKNSSI